MSTYIKSKIDALFINIFNFNPIYNTTKEKTKIVHKPFFGKRPIVTSVPYMYEETMAKNMNNK